MTKGFWWGITVLPVLIFIMALAGGTGQDELAGLIGLSLIFAVPGWIGWMIWEAVND